MFGKKPCWPRLFTLIFNENKQIFVAGDFNIAILNKTTIGTEIVSLMNSFNLFPMVNENTRITLTSASWIDNIFTNWESVYETIVMENFISDHTAQKITFETQLKKPEPLIYKRIFSQESKKYFFALHKEQNWIDIDIHINVTKKIPIIVNGPYL